MFMCDTGSPIWIYSDPYFILSTRLTVPVNWIKVKQSSSFLCHGEQTDGKSLCSSFWRHNFHRGLLSTTRYDYFPIPYMSLANVQCCRDIHRRIPVFRYIHRNLSMLLEALFKCKQCVWDWARLLIHMSEFQPKLWAVAYHLTHPWVVSICD